ncbi:MAG: hypothetical protein ACP5HQ_06980 [Thermoprotei archaeon]
MLYAKEFGPIATTLFNVGGYLIFMKLPALAMNLAVTLIGTAIAYAVGRGP